MAAGDSDRRGLKRGGLDRQLLCKGFGDHDWAPGCATDRQRVDAVDGHDGLLLVVLDHQRRVDTRSAPPKQCDGFDG